jgi:TfoX/Sxy family transcriptional regulator of competence genes
MAYSESLAHRVRAVLQNESGLSEKKMFGGLAFLLNGNMCCGIVRDELMVRVGAEQYQAALAQPHARPIDFTGRPMTGMIFVSAEEIAADNRLAEWVNQGARFAGALPAKETAQKRSPRRTGKMTK